MSRNPGPPRAVFDCNTFIQALASDQGPAAECLRHVEAGDVRLFLSRPILRELRRVLTYPEVLEISPNMTDARIEAFLDRLTYRSALVRQVKRSIRFPRDPKDEPYLDLAISIDADYLVTRDHDLLWLMTGHAPVCKQFRRQAPSTAIVSPELFLHSIESET